jgi:hypothetical protein
MRKILYILLILLASNLYAQNQDEVNSVISFSARAITPIGDFSENWTTGVAAYVSYSWLYNQKWSVRLQTGFNKYSLKSESEYSNSSKLTMIPIQFGARVHFFKRKFRLFFEAMSGVNFISLNYEDEDRKVDESYTHINFQIGGGVLYRIIDNLEIELAVLYNSHMIEPSKPINLTGFEYGVGVNWIF